MKRFSLVGIGVLGLTSMASILGGCPIFSDGSGNGTQVCEGDYCGCQGTDCPENTCSQPADCPSGETCGSDGLCHTSDCSFNGCPSGYSCEFGPNGNDASCVATGTGGAGVGGGTTVSSSSGGGSATTTSTSSSSSGSTGNGGATTTTTTSSSSSSSSGAATTSSSSSSSSSSSGAPLVYCGHPADCATGSICGANGTCQPGPCSATNACILGYACANDGTCQAEVPNACDKDSDCASGSACVAGAQGGVCTAVANECFDQSQCDSGDDCVNGKCTPSCTSNAQCRDGYACNTVTGTCTVVLASCVVTNDCASATEVCVGGACVPRSTNGTCTNANDVWDENGCVPNQSATFTCSVDGAQGACSAGSICLHHDCWISCDAPNQNVCASQTTLNTCKPVADNGTTYNVCGSSTNLGSQCGAGSANNATCSGGAVCIDGFCK